MCDRLQSCSKHALADLPLFQSLTINDDIVRCTLAEAGMSVPAFCPTRVAAEQMVSRMVRHVDDEHYSFVRIHQARLSPEERRNRRRTSRPFCAAVVFVPWPITLTSPFFRCVDAESATENLRVAMIERTLPSALLLPLTSQSATAIPAGSRRED